MNPPKSFRWKAKRHRIIVGINLATCFVIDRHTFTKQDTCLRVVNHGQQGRIDNMEIEESGRCNGPAAQALPKLIPVISIGEVINQPKGDEQKGEYNRSKLDGQPGAYLHD